MTEKRVMAILKKNGWIHERTSGSHYIFSKPGAIRPVAVPKHGNADLGVFAKNLLKEAGIKSEEQ